VDHKTYKTYTTEDGEMRAGCEVLASFGEWRTVVQYDGATVKVSFGSSFGPFTRAGVSYVTRAAWVTETEARSVLGKVAAEYGALAWETQ